MDIATLGIRIDATTADDAARSLDRLTQAGARAQTAASGTTRATAAAAESTRRYTAEQIRAAQAIERFAQASGRLNAASRAVAVSAGQMRSGLQQLSFQIGDISQQFALGVRPMTIFIQQGGQVIQALQMMGGQGNAFLRFLGGPWGIGVAAATVVLAPLIARLFDTRTELERAVDELRNNAREAENTRAAQAAFGATLPGISERIREQTEALQQQNRSMQENQRLALGRAQAEQRNLSGPMLSANIAAQAAMRGRILGLEAEIAGGRPNRFATMPAPQALRMAREELARLQQENIAIQAKAAAAGEAVRAARIPIIRREAEALADPLAAIRERFQGMRDAAEAARPSMEQLRATLANINRQERAALEAQQRAGRSSSIERGLTRPTAGALLSPFGASRSMVPINGRLVNRSHQGVDLRGNVGDAVVAPEGGSAFVRNAPGGLGLYVEIRADSGARHLLGHLSGANVQSGDRVTAGQLVGLVGASGNAAGGTPHLHHQMMVGGRWVDPTRRYGASGAASAAQAVQRAAEQEAERAARVALQRQSKIDEEIERITRQKVEVAQGQLEVSQADLRTQEEIARMQGEFAGTAAERRASQLRLLAISEQMERAELEALRLSSDPAARSRADNRLAALPQIYGMRRQQIDRESEGPMARYLREMRATTAEVSREVEGVQVRAFDSLADAIAGVVSGTQSLGDAFSNMARSIVSDIIQMTVRMLIFRAVSGLFGGGAMTGVGGALSGIGSGLGAGLPRMANGGEFMVNGLSGDRNLLSVNGVPQALVAAGEQVSVSPRRAANNNGPTQVHVTVGFGPAPEFAPYVHQVSAAHAAEAVQVSVSHTNSLVGNAMRPALNGRR